MMGDGTAARHTKMKDGGVHYCQLREESFDDDQ